MRILKYEIKLPKGNKIRVNIGSNPLCVEKQGDKIFVWELVQDHIIEYEDHNFVILMTGEDKHPTFFSEYSYLGTIHDFKGFYVLHIFYKKSMVIGEQNE